MSHCVSDEQYRPFLGGIDSHLLTPTPNVALLTRPGVPLFCFVLFCLSVPRRHEITITLTDRGFPALVALSRALVTLELTDVNDNRPAFQLFMGVRQLRHHLGRFLARSPYTLRRELYLVHMLAVC